MALPVRAAAPLRALLVLALVALLGACADAPTLPHTLQQLAGGQEWAAVTVPSDLPDAGSWLPFVADGVDGEGGAARVLALQAEAAEAERAGRLERSLTLRHHAERAAIASLARNPPPALVMRALNAVDLWAEWVRGQADLERAPELGRSLLSVETAHVAAHAALTAGDTATALLHVAGAAERIRAHAPAAVAVRVLDTVELRIRALPRQDLASRRALHLISAAREELLEGDPKRALQRALYALQIADGQSLLIESEPATPACEGAGC